MSRRSDVFSSSRRPRCRATATSADPASAGTRQGRAAQPGRPASHPPAQDHLARIHPARRRVAARRAASRARDIAKRAAAEGSGDFVEQVSCELPLQAIAGLMGVPQEDRKKLFDWSNQMVGDQDPEFARNDPIGRIGRADHVRHADGRRATARTRGDDLVTKLVQADVEGHKLTDDEFGFFVILLAVAGNETTRNSITQGMMAFTDFPDQWELFKTRAPGDRRRRDRPVGHPGHLVPAHRARGHRARRRRDQEGRAGGDVLPLGQLRRGSLRRSATPSTSCATPTRTSDSAAPVRTTASVRTWPDDDRPDVQRHRRPHARPHPARPSPSGCGRAGSTASSTGRSTTRAQASPLSRIAIQSGRDGIQLDTDRCRR